MEKKWKIGIHLYDEGCDAIDDYELVIDDDMPFLPRKGERLIVSDEISEKLDERVRQCWRKRKCKDCPFMYFGLHDDKSIRTDDWCVVNDVIYGMDDKIISIYLVKNR